MRYVNEDQHSPESVAALDVLNLLRDHESDLQYYGPLLG